MTDLLASRSLPHDVGQSLLPAVSPFLPAGAAAVELELVTQRRQALVRRRRGRRLHKLQF